MKIGFVGFGNMARAIAGGIVKQGLVPAGEVCAFDVNEGALNAAKAFGFTGVTSESAVLQNADFVFLCVKPQGFAELLPRLKPYVRQGNIFLSIAAGINIKSITALLGDVPVIRAMPNTPLQLGCGTTALTSSGGVDGHAFQFVKDVFASVGTVYELPEDKFNEVINVNGSTPAYVYLFAQAVAQFASESGIAFDLALRMFCDTMVGSAKMLTESGKAPDELIEMVSSKGGTTVAALEKFKETGFVTSLRAGMKACVDRAYEMSL